MQTIAEQYQSLLAFHIQKKRKMSTTDSIDIINDENECIIFNNDIELESSMAYEMTSGHHIHFHQTCILSWSRCSQNFQICNKILQKESLEIIDDNVASEIKTQTICEVNHNPVAERIKNRIMNDKKGEIPSLSS